MSQIDIQKTAITSGETLFFDSRTPINNDTTRYVEEERDKKANATKIAHSMSHSNSIPTKPKVLVPADLKLFSQGSGQKNERDHGPNN